MYQDNKIWIGQSEGENIYIYPKMANRHGLIAGATGTGKTVTLKVMAESFSDAGVPVFLADVKGDLASICHAGENSGSVADRVQKLSLLEKGFSFNAYPVNFWDVYGEKGINLRTTVSEMGPLLLGRILDLNDTQADLLAVVFKIADDEQMLLLDTKDLKSFINYVADNADNYSSAYGNIAKNSLNVIIRSIVALESQGGEQFFSEPALNIKEMCTQTYDGKGMINVLACEKLINNPSMYSTFMLWLLTELYETLPEAGDLEKPKMVFFFDEAHMLFESASKALLAKIEQIIKLIRSKGVGIYFITQNPQDVPDEVLGQLSNKIQHALRAYTPKELKGAKVAAESFRENPAFDTFSVLTELGVGEALVSVLDEQGIPTIVKRTSILPPQSYLGTIDELERQRLIENNTLYSKYNEVFDRVSAYEVLEQKAQSNVEQSVQKEDEQAARIAALEAELAAVKAGYSNDYDDRRSSLVKTPDSDRRSSLVKTPDNDRRSSLYKEPTESSRSSYVKEPSSRKSKDDSTAKAIKKATKSVASTTAGTIGRELGNTLGKSTGSSFGKRLGGNVGASIGRNLMGIMFK